MKKTMSTSKDKETKSIKGAVTGRISAQNPNISQNMARSENNMLKKPPWSDQLARTDGNSLIYIGSTQKDKNVGDIVCLYPFSSYTASPSNPKIGSQWECYGEVIIARPRGENNQHLTVKWANGRTNSYNREHLYLAYQEKESNDPNYLFSMKNRRCRN